MVHYTHLTKIKAHHTRYPPTSICMYIFIFFNDDHEEREEVKFHENTNIEKIIFYENTNRKLYKSKEGKAIAKFYTFCVKLSGEREKRKKEKKKKKKIR